MQVRRVVTCFLYSKGRILILRRSGAVGSYRGKWAGVSGYVEDGVEEQAYREIEEETGLKRGDVQLVRSGPPLEVVDEGLEVKWIVHPYLFKVSSAKGVRLDWEHVEAKWIRPEELVFYEAVPKLIEAFSRIWNNDESKI